MSIYISTSMLIFIGVEEKNSKVDITVDSEVDIAVNNTIQCDDLCVDIKIDIYFNKHLCIKNVLI